MEKLLIDKYANIVAYDTENNVIKYLPNIAANTAFIANEDGQAISNTEVIDYKKGDLIIVLRAYLNKNWITKVVRCEDVFAKDDLIQWCEQIKKADEAV